MNELNFKKLSPNPNQKLKGMCVAKVVGMMQGACEVLYK